MSMDDIFVSVILPSLNVYSYIEKCIKSVQHQTLNDIEILCVDAGSTDGTLDILCKAQKEDDRIRILHSEIKSYGYQINMGVDFAKGKYIAIVDTDDYIDENMLYDLFSTAQTCEYPDYVKGNSCQFIVYSGKEITAHMPSKRYPEKKRIILNTDRREAFDNCGAIWDGIYRLDFLKQNGIRLNESPGAAFQDTSFVLLVVSMAHSAAFRHGYFYYYRVDNNDSSTKNQSMWHAIIDELFYLKNCLKEHGLYNHDIQNLYLIEKIRRYWWNLERLDNGNRKRFIDEISQEIKTDIENGSFLDDLDNYDKLCLNKMLNKDLIDIDLERKKTEELLKKVLISENEYIIVSAGLWCERLLIWHELNGINKIICVCDNSIKKQNSIIHGYRVCSVDDAINAGEKTNVEYIIANRTNYASIKAQLVSLGVSDKQIMDCFIVPDLSKLVYIKE